MTSEAEFTQPCEIKRMPVFFGLCIAKCIAVEGKRLSDSIRDRINRGILPSDYDSPAEVAIGDGRACGCCDKALTNSDVRYDIVHREKNGRRILISMHGTCLHSWRDVVDALARQRSGSGSD